MGFEISYQHICTLQFWDSLLFLLQATIKPPVIKNMEKALWFQFTVGVLPVFAVVFVGYWAYGSSTSTYLLNSVSGPTWVKAMANLAAFFQTVVALHVLPLTLVIIFLLLFLHNWGQVSSRLLEKIILHLKTINRS